MSDTSPEALQMPIQPQPDVSDPAKLIRLGTMVQTLLAEVQRAAPDEAGRMRLAAIHNETVDELGEILSEDLREELNEFNVCCGQNESPSDGEIRIAQAQLVGWLQGLLRGMQASATAQAAMAQRQLMQVQAGDPRMHAAQQQAMAQQQGGMPPQQAPQGPPRKSGPPMTPDSGYL